MKISHIYLSLPEGNLFSLPDLHRLTNLIQVYYVYVSFPYLRLVSCCQAFFKKINTKTTRQLRQVTQSLRQRRPEAEDLPEEATGISIAGWFISGNIPPIKGWWLGVPPLMETPING